MTKIADTFHLDGLGRDGIITHYGRGPAADETLDAIIACAEARYAVTPFDVKNMLLEAHDRFATREFRGAVYQALKDRGIRHAPGPRMALFTAWQQHVAYMVWRPAYGYHPPSLLGVEQAVGSLMEFLCGDLPIVWRIEPQANHSGGYYARLVQVTPQMFDLVTSPDYIKIAENKERADDNIGSAVTVGRSDPFGGDQ